MYGDDGSAETTDLRRPWTAESTDFQGDRQMRGPRIRGLHTEDQEPWSEKTMIIKYY